MPEKNIIEHRFLFNKNCAKYDMHSAQNIILLFIFFEVSERYVLELHWDIVRKSCGNIVFTALIKIVFLDRVRSVGLRRYYRTASLRAFFIDSAVREIVDAVTVNEVDSLVIYCEVIKMVVTAEYALRAAEA